LSRFCSCLKAVFKLIISKTTSWNKGLENRIGKFIIRTAYLFTVLVILPVIWWLYFERSNMPDIESFIRGSPTVGQVYDANGEIIIQLAKEYRRIVPYANIPTDVRNAILAAEDTRFFNYWVNHGVDYIAIVRATLINGAYTSLSSYKKRKFDFVSAEGASTITQQIVRLYFLSDIITKESSNQLIYNNPVTRNLARVFEVREVNKIIRKMIELKYAIWLESEMTKIYGSRTEAKKQIFMRFTPYLGNGRYGFDTASEYYFNKHVWELNHDDIEKAALLAGMIKNPSIYIPRFGQKPELDKVQLARRNVIIDRMAEKNIFSKGYITQEENIRYKSRPIKIEARNNIKTIAPSVISEIFKETRDNGLDSEEIFQGNLQIKTTVDLKIQKIVNQSLNKGLETYETRHPDQKDMVQGSIIILRNSDAAILAMAGGREFYQGQRYKYSDLNRVKRVRQAGSAFKPFVYFTAFENGRTPNDIVIDAPFAIRRGYGRGTHPIHNYDGKYLGAISYKEAMKRSRNVPAIKVALALGDGRESGMEKIEKVIKILGIESPLHFDIDHKNKKIIYITSALGASEVNVLELANAYRALASGLSAKPYMIKEITDRGGKSLFIKKNNGKLLPFNQKIIKMIQYCMRAVVMEPGGTAYSLTAQKFPIPVMGKTGTTNDFRNALFAGSTYGPDGITVVVRIDFDDNRQLAPKETGALVALPIFKEIVQKIYEQNLVGSVPQFPEEIENGEFLTSLQ